VEITNLRLPSTGRRSVKRRRARNFLYTKAVRLVVAVLALLGPNEKATKSTYESKLAKARRLQRKLTYRSNNVKNSGAVALEAMSPPPWVGDLYLSARSEGAELKVLFKSCMEICCRSCCPPPTDVVKGVGSATTLNIETVLSGDYSISKMQKSCLYEPIDWRRLDLPEPGFRQMEVANFLKSWPWNELFSPAGVAALRKPPELLKLDPGPRARLHLAEKADYATIIRLLVDCGLVDLCSLADTAGMPDNGLFAVKKPNGKQRLIVDCQPGNYMDWGMQELQRRYELLLTANPERAHALRLPSRVMEICSPSDIAALPSGAVSKTISDFSNFFHQLKALPGSRSGQCLPAVDLGNGLVRPVYGTLPMGHWLAALLSHLFHKEMMAPLVAEPLIFRKPEHTDASHRAACADIAAKVDEAGLVGLAELPSSMLKAFSTAARVPLDGLTHNWLANFRCPPSALYLQPAQPHDPPDHCLTVASHILGDAGFEATLGASRDRERKGSGMVFDVCGLIYIDDHHALLYPPVSSPAASLRLAPAVGDAQRLAASLHSANAGCELNTPKLKWSSSATSPSLGVDIEFLTHEPGWPMRVAVAPERRGSTEAQVRALLAGKFTHITEEYFDHLVGKLVWDVLVRRPFLSVYDLVFRARHSKNRPTGLVWLSPRLRQELAMIVDLLPLMEHRSKPLSDMMYIFDASGVNSLGNGGYGVVQRKGVTPRIIAEVMGDAYNRLPLYRIGDDGTPPTATKAAAEATKFILQDWNAPTLNWEVMRAGEFERPPPHVNVAEAATGGMTIRVACGNKAVRGHRVAIGGDNTASLCALRKGRSSSFRINGTCRRVAALTFVHDFDALWFWLPSKANPSDGPSRWWMQGRREVKPTYPGSHWQRDIAAEKGEASHPGPAPPKVRHPFKGSTVVVDQDDPAHLASFSVKPKTLSGYLSAWTGFACYLAATSLHHSDFASALESYVEMAWESQGGITNGDCTNLLVGLAFVAPELKARGVMALAWRAMAGWSKLRPTKSWNPINWTLLLFFAVLLVWNSETDAAIALLLSHHTYGRGSEINDLLDDDIALPGDPRCLEGTHGSVLFYNTKAGKMQAVPLDDLLVIQLLAYQRARNRSRPGRKGRFFPDLAKRGKYSLLERFKRVQRAAGFPEPLWVRHSCRHGGATRDYVTRRRLVPDIMVRGRWSSQKVCEGYLNGAQAQYLSLIFPALVRRRMAAMGDAEEALRTALGL
jgi:hypothetical protein